MDLLIQIVLIVVSAFSGAWVALLFEERRRKRQEKKGQHIALRETHFILLQQLVDSRNRRFQLLDQFKGDPQKWFKLHPMKEYGSPLSIDIKQLLFILRSDDPNLLNRLHVGQNKLQTLIGTIDRRSELHMQFQERLAVLQQQGHFKGGETHEAEMEFLVGKDLVAHLKDTTDFIYETYEEVEEFIKRNMTDLEGYLQLNFPKERAPAYELLDSPPSADVQQQPPEGNGDPPPPNDPTQQV